MAAGCGFLKHRKIICWTFDSPYRRQLQIHALKAGLDGRLPLKMASPHMEALNIGASSYF